MEVKLSLINKIVPSLWHPKSTAINNPARLSLGVSGEGGGGLGMAGCLLPSTQICFGFAISSSRNNTTSSLERNETGGCRKNCADPQLPLEFLFSARIRITTSWYGRHLENEALEVPSKGDNGLSKDEKSTGCRLFCNTAAPWRRRPTSTDPRSEQRGGAGFYENLNFCFFWLILNM